MKRPHDDVVDTPGAIVIGAGIAGLFTASKLAPYPVLVLNASTVGFGGSSVWAQGGIAAALGADDSPQLHAADTIRAGGGLCDPVVAEFVAREASTRIEDLLRFGAPFDLGRDGGVSLAREAAHSRSRIVHVSGDRAGAEIMRALATAALATPSVSIVENVHAISLAKDDERVTGVCVDHGPGSNSHPTLFRSRAVILASGGLGALYSVTTNPPESLGEGLGMAAQAGALIADPEFVQFHPTAMDVGRDPAPLATEALRGEGAILIDERGRRFMADIHPAAELAPRDVVARAIFREMAHGHRVFLDCRTAPGARLVSHFPTVYAACRSAGIDPTTEPVPIAPAAHYHMGGVATDHYGRSTLPGLWCVGECASTGLHGANRLASNSLLEALVFGARVADSVRGETGLAASGTAQYAPSGGLRQSLPADFRTAMMRWVGLERDADGLRKALAMIAEAGRPDEIDFKVRNCLAAAQLITAAAFARRESIGAHFRLDFPKSSDCPRRTFLTLADAGTITEEAGIPNPNMRMVHQ